MLTDRVGRWLTTVLSSVALASVMTLAGGAAAATGANLQMPGAHASYQQWQDWAAQEQTLMQSVDWMNTPGAYKVQLVPVVSNGTGKIPKGIVIESVVIWGHGSSAHSGLQPTKGRLATSASPDIASYCSWMTSGVSGNITDGVACVGLDYISGTYHNAAEYYDTSGYLLGHLELGYGGSADCSTIGTALQNTSDGSLSPGSFVRIVYGGSVGGEESSTWWERLSLNGSTVYQSYGTVCTFNY